MLPLAFFHSFIHFIFLFYCFAINLLPVFLFSTFFLYFTLFSFLLIFTLYLSLFPSPPSFPPSILPTFSFLSFIFFLTFPVRLLSFAIASSSFYLLFPTFFLSIHFLFHRHLFSLVAIFISFHSFPRFFLLSYTPFHVSFIHFYSFLVLLSVGLFVFLFFSSSLLLDHTLSNKISILNFTLYLLCFRSSLSVPLIFFLSILSRAFSLLLRSFYSFLFFSRSLFCYHFLSFFFTILFFYLLTYSHKHAHIFCQDFSTYFFFLSLSIVYFRLSVSRVPTLFSNLPNTLPQICWNGTKRD